MLDCGIVQILKVPQRSIVDIMTENHIQQVRNSERGSSLNVIMLYNLLLPEFSLKMPKNRIHLFIESFHRTSRRSMKFESSNLIFLIFMNTVSYGLLRNCLAVGNVVYPEFMKHKNYLYKLVLKEKKKKLI